MNARNMDPRNQRQELYLIINPDEITILQNNIEKQHSNLKFE